MLILFSVKFNAAIQSKLRAERAKTLTHGENLDPEWICPLRELFEGGLMWRQGQFSRCTGGGSFSYFFSARLRCDFSLPLSAVEHTVCTVVVCFIEWAKFSTEWGFAFV